mmetsp:Transcript_19559/g.58653  ORF Transcript_19559/g.58653 Transcript_19559/m.58653 type:complete len:302 (+) Transcript_19559:723-1628(+)
MASSLCSASRFSASSLSMMAWSRSFSAWSCPATAASRSFSACSFSSSAFRIALIASFSLRSASRCALRASSMRFTCSATSSFARSSSPKAWASCACRMRISSSCFSLSWKSCRSISQTTLSSWKARKTTWRRRLSRSIWMTLIRASHAAFRIFFWCSSFSLSASCWALNLNLTSSKVTPSQEQTRARWTRSSFQINFFSMMISRRLTILASFLSPSSIRFATFSFSPSSSSSSLSMSSFRTRMVSYCFCSSSTIEAPSVPASSRHSRSRSKSSWILPSMASFRRWTSAQYFLYISSFSFSL